MTTDRFTEEHIKRHINFYTTSSVADRGRQLYKRDKVFFNDYIEKTDSWKFTVIGSQKYQVLVKGVKNQDIQTSCTCPFDWGSICKHAVAAMLFISDNLGEQSVLKNEKQSQITFSVSNRKGKNAGFEIPDYKHIDFDFVKQNANTNILSQIIYLHNYIQNYTIEISKDSLTFVSTNDGAYVKFFMEDGKVYVTSPMAAKSPKLTSAEARCLAMIANSAMPGLLDEVFSGRIMKTQSEMLRKYGLPESANFNDYFYYGFTKESGLLHYMSKKGEGLVPVTEDGDNYITAILKELNNDELLPDGLPKKTEHRELGFVLKKGVFFDYYNRYDDYYDEENDQYKIMPITGKTSKNNPSALRHSH